MLFIRLFSALLLALILPIVALGQDAKTAPGKTDAAKSEPAKTESKPAPAAAADKPAEKEVDPKLTAAFDEALKKWEDLLKELRDLQIEYKSAKPADRAGLRHKFDDLVETGDESRASLETAAQALYLASPNTNTNTKVTEVLVSMIHQDLRDENYEQALKIAKLLIDNKFTNPRIYNLAGIAEYELDDFEQAQKDLELAKEKKALDSKGRDLAAAVGDSTKIVSRDLERDDYDAALRRAKKFIDAGKTSRELFNLAGMAAYHAGDYADAETWLGKAKQLDSLTDDAKQLLASLPDTKAAWEKEKKLRDAEAKADDLPRVELKTTAGTIVVELFENEAPNTVANFIYLVDQGYYNGVPFHRVLEHFMAQGGDPTGTGTGGPGYTIPCECFDPDARMHFRGSLSMAHAGKDTGGSQFFLTFLRTAQLDGKHTVFGRVIEGMDVLSKIERVDPSKFDQPEPDRIIEAKVLRKRNHEYVPKRTPK